MKSKSLHLDIPLRSPLKQLHFLNNRNRPSPKKNVKVKTNAIFQLFDDQNENHHHHHQLKKQKITPPVQDFLLDESASDWTSNYNHFYCPQDKEQSSGRKDGSLSSISDESSKFTFLSSSNSHDSQNSSSNQCQRSFPIEEDATRNFQVIVDAPEKEGSPSDSKEIKYLEDWANEILLVRSTQVVSDQRSKEVDQDNDFNIDQVNNSRDNFNFDFYNSTSSSNKSVISNSSMKNRDTNNKSKSSNNDNNSDNGNSNLNHYRKTEYTLDSIIRMVLNETKRLPEGTFIPISDQLRTIRIILISLEQSRKEQLCSLCFSQFNVSDQVHGLRCGHCYHAKCLSLWRRCCDECPGCRLKLPCEIFNLVKDDNHNYGLGENSIMCGNLIVNQKQQENKFEMDTS